MKDYAREAGVRSLLKLIEKIYRKAALALVRYGVSSSVSFLSFFPSFLVSIYEGWI